MAKAITSKTESLTIRVPVDLMADLRAEAKASGASVGSVFVGRVRENLIVPLGPPVSEVANDLAHALIELGDANEIIERQANEIADLRRNWDDARADGRRVRHLLAQAGDERQVWFERATAAETEIVSLKAALAARPVNPVVQALRFDPANRIIDPKVHHVSGPVLADTVPPIVEGDAVGFNLKGQTKGKGKP